MVDHTQQPARIIPLRPELVELTGDVISALLLQQLCYWTSRTRNADGWIYKTGPDLAEELSNGASARTINRKLAALEAAGLIRSRESVRRHSGTARDYAVNRTDIRVENVVQIASDGRFPKSDNKPTNCLTSRQNDAQADKMTTPPAETPSEADSDKPTNCLTSRQNDAQADKMSPIQRSTEKNTTTTTPAREPSPVCGAEDESTSTPKPDPGDIDLDRYIHQELTDHGLEPRIGEAQQIARRLMLSELSEPDRRRYLVDDAARLRGKFDAGTIDRRTAIDWLGSTRGISWWLTSVKAARQATGPGSVAGKTRLTVPCDAVDEESDAGGAWYDATTNTWKNVEGTDAD
jgi:hypothetical protein